MSAASDLLAQAPQSTAQAVAQRSHRRLQLADDGMRLWQRLRQHQLCVHTTQSAHRDGFRQVTPPLTGIPQGFALFGCSPLVAGPLSAFGISPPDGREPESPLASIRRHRRA